MTTAQGLWMQRIHTALEQLSVIPIWGSAPEFPWDALGQRLSSDLGIPAIEISPERNAFLEGEKTRTGLGDSPHVLTLSLTPLPGEVFWIFPRKDMATFTHLIMSEEGKGLSDEARAEAITATDHIRQIQTFARNAYLMGIRHLLQEPFGPLRKGLGTNRTA